MVARSQGYCVCLFAPASLCHWVTPVGAPKEPSFLPRFFIFFLAEEKEDKHHPISTHSSNCSLILPLEMAWPYYGSRKLLASK